MTYHPSKHIFLAAYTHLSILRSILESITFGTRPDLPTHLSPSLMPDHTDSLIYSIPTLFLVCLISTPHFPTGGQGTIICQRRHIDCIAFSSLVHLAQVHIPFPFWVPDSQKLRHWCFCRITSAMISLLTSISYPVETPNLISLLLNNDWIWELNALPSATSSLGPFLSETQCARFTELRVGVSDAWTPWIALNLGAGVDLYGIR